MNKKNAVFLLFYRTWKNKDMINRTKTNTGGLVEYTKADEWIILKELGKMTL